MSQPPRHGKKANLAVPRRRSHFTAVLAGRRQPAYIRHIVRQQRAEAARMRVSSSGGDYKRQRLAAPSDTTMPAVRRGRRRARTAVRRRKRYGRNVRPQRSIKNIPYAITRVLTTTFRVNLDPASGSAITANVIALNGAYDPSLAMGAVQPLYFDQYNAMYQQNTVLGWNLQIDAVSTDNTNATIIGVTPMTTSTALSVPEHYLEAKGTTHKIMTQDIDKVVIYNRGSVKKWLRPNGGSLINDTTYSGSPTGNPTTVLFGHIWAAAVSYTGTDPATVQTIVKLQQVVRFFNPVVPARS